MVVIRQSVLDEIYRHGRATPDIEVCGVLVGEIVEDESGRYTYADAMIRGEGAESQAGAVTFTAATWTHIQKEMDERYEDKKIIGWYHTHPGFGIFLSDMDEFIHEQFFNEPWQIALVYDPVREEQGVFHWVDGKVAMGPFEVEDDKALERHAARRQTERRARRIHKRLTVLLATLATVLVATLGWLALAPVLAGGH